LCQSGNIKVSSVATDLFGVSGRKMLAAIVEGKHDAGWIADYARSVETKPRESQIVNKQLQSVAKGKQRDSSKFNVSKCLRHSLTKRRGKFMPNTWCCCFSAAALFECWADREAHGRAAVQLRGQIFRYERAVQTAP
jgi:hypothetical protein